MGDKSAQNLVAALEQEQAHDAAALPLRPGHPPCRRDRRRKDLAQALRRARSHHGRQRRAAAARCPTSGPIVAQSIRTFFEQPHNREVVEQLRACGVHLGRARGRAGRRRAQAAGRQDLRADRHAAHAERDEAKELIEAAGGKVSGSVVEEDRLRGGRRRGRQQARQGARARRGGARRGRLAGAAAQDLSAACRRAAADNGASTDAHRTATHDDTMAVREILKMGDPRLLRVAQPVREFDTPALRALIDDMFDTMARGRRRRAGRAADRRRPATGDLRLRPQRALPRCARRAA